MTTSRARLHGFTMIELLATISLVGVLMALAVPAFNTFIKNQRIANATNLLVLSLNLARSEALKRDQPSGITVCASSDQATCSGGDWDNGFIVIDTSGSAIAGVLQTSAKVPNDTISEVAGQTFVVYQSNGTVAQAASFTICDDRGAGYAHSIDVGPTGRVLSSSTPGRSVNGAALVCP